MYSFFPTKINNPAAYDAHSSDFNPLPNIFDRNSFRSVKIKTTVLLLSFYTFTVYGGDTAYLKVHFLYGSRPIKKYKSTESKWFGGILGGHVGIESDDDKIINFLPTGDFHVFARKHSRNSAFAVSSFEEFYSMFNSDTDSVKRSIFYIPVSTKQKRLFDSISRSYIARTPYDYAFFGMRCGAAAYDILGQLDILPIHNYRKTYIKIFYPRKLRNILFKLAEENHWVVLQQHGSSKRKWEKDR